MGKKSRLKKERRNARTIFTGILDHNKYDVTTISTSSSSRINMYAAAAASMASSKITMPQNPTKMKHITNQIFVAPLLQTILRFEYLESGLWLPHTTTVNVSPRYYMGVDSDVLTGEREQLLDMVATSPACRMCRYSFLCLQGDKSPNVCMHCRVVLPKISTYEIRCGDSKVPLPTTEEHPAYAQERMKVSTSCPIFQASTTLCDFCDTRWGAKTKSKALARQAKEEMYKFLYGGQTMRALEEHEAVHRKQSKRRIRVLWEYVAAKPFNPMIDFLRKKYDRRKNDASAWESRKKKR